MATDNNPEKYLTYRGDIRALAEQGGKLLFVTVHPEAVDTPLYELDLDEGTLAEIPLSSSGARAIVVAEKTAYVAGEDGAIYEVTLTGKKRVGKAIGAALGAPCSALALLAKERLAAISGADLVILARKSGAELQRIALGEDATALAANPNGTWLAVGTAQGTIAVFEAEKKPDEFTRSDARKLHEGAVTALLFDREELRIYSAAADGKLLSTHARGKLESEDRGGKSNHEEAITAFCHGLGGHFHTGSSDKSFKTWPTKNRPVTVSDGVTAVVALCLTTYLKRSHLAVACADATIRVWDLEEDGRPKEPRAIIARGAIARAKHELDQKEAARREGALRELAGYNDATALEMLAQRAIDDPDHKLRGIATELLAATKNPRALEPLERLLGAPDEEVRREALAGLRHLAGEANLRPLRLAIEGGKLDIGLEAIKALEALAKKDDQALELLLKALDRNPVEVRTAALASIEAVHSKAPVDALIFGLRSGQADIRRLALVRLFEHKLLDEPAVQAALRRHGEDADADVRLTAFFCSALSRPKLATALRERSKELHRKLWEIESAAARGAGQKDIEEPKAPKKITVEAKDLGDADKRPLLQAMASRALDTCLRGATALALLQDGRAFGTLLQLSRETDEGTRVEVCKALRHLADPRGIARLRLMIRDPQAGVRDAAFSALANLEAETPLETAEAGLMAEHEDVRRRALEMLIKELKSAKAERPIHLLSRALNDSFPAVRSEAFKATLNLAIEGGGEKTLRFALRSLHRDVRHEALVETMAQIQEPWAWRLLLDLLRDPDAGLRREAFDFAKSKAKNKLVDVLASALDGPYADLRGEATKALSGCSKEPGADPLRLEQLLFRALDDEDERVRQLGLDVLLASASPALAQVMKSKHPDVRVRAAHARATDGDPEALLPLLQLVTEKEPELSDLKPKWRSRVGLALEGLAELGSPGALESLRPLLESKDADIRRTAALAIAQSSRPENTEALREALRHADRAVQLEAALGLAACGDTTGAAVLFSTADPATALQAAIALGPKAENNLISFLDHSDAAIRSQAFTALMLLERSDPRPSPERCLAGLSANNPDIRLKSARALESSSAPKEFQTFVATLFNDRDDDKPWTVPDDTIDALGAVLAHGESTLRFRASRLLRHLGDKKQDAFDQQWQRFAKRFSKELAALDAGRTKKGAKPAAATARPNNDELARLIFGSYVGLSRLHGHDSATRIRQTALSRLAEARRKDPKLEDAVRPVLVLALGDSTQAVRKQAFELLAELTPDAKALCADALASGQRDVAALGFEKLLGSDKKGSRTILERVLKTHTDGLEHEAAKALSEQLGETAAAELGFEVRSEERRRESVRGLAQHYEDPKAAAALRNALQTRFRDVRLLAATELAAKKDPAAFEVLAELLRSDQRDEQQQALNGLNQLGDPRAPGVFLDRLEKDPAGTALSAKLFEAVGEARRPEVMDRLLTLYRKVFRQPVAAAILKISGYDQTIGSDTDEPGWEKKQHPRHDAVLARFLEAAIRASDEKQVVELIPAARWCRAKDVNGSLAALAAHPQERLRHAAVEAIGWRLRERTGPKESLLKNLEHPDLTTRFLAAEGLGLAGHKEALNALQVSVELSEDLDHRKRAVKALGKLGDEQALDLLLRLINEDGHALQDEAAEALGHMRKSKQADEVFKTLERISQGNATVARSALTGLRWFGSPAAWAILRARATDGSWVVRQTIAGLLGHDADPMGREILRRMVEKDHDSDVVQEAVKSLRKLCGADSLEPDYSLICCQHPWLVSNTLERLKEKGDPVALLDVLPKIPENLVAKVTEVLLSRAPLPVAEAAAVLENSLQERTLRVAAQILGRAGKAAAAQGARLAKATERFQKRWEDERRKVSDEDNALAQKMAPFTATYALMLWSCGRLGVGGSALIAATDGRFSKEVRRAALTSLSTGSAGEPGLEAMTKAITDTDAEVRALAASGLRKIAPKRAAALIEKSLDDRTSLDRLLEDSQGAEGSDALRKAAVTIHHQGVALPHLVARKDIAGLSAALADKKLPETTRLGLLEGLAGIASLEAEAALLAIQKDQGEDEDLRKAAWRAVKRAQRNRGRLAKIAGVAALPVLPKLIQRVS